MQTHQSFKFDGEYILEFLYDPTPVELGIDHCPYAHLFAVVVIRKLWLVSKVIRKLWLVSNCSEMHFGKFQ
ncbi:hypothetical protein QE152_g1768 [Popillia japonica]|uniref:Uncharacterized protein n=1 Tax=Popillia japonica TaxID=7064 RepID=A0AAW1N5Y0_POPJA